MEHYEGKCHNKEQDIHPKWSKGEDETSSRKMAVELTAMLKEPQEYLASTDYSLHVAAIFCILHNWARWLDRSPFS